MAARATSLNTGFGFFSVYVGLPPIIGERGANTTGQYPEYRFSVVALGDRRGNWRAGVWWELFELGVGDDPK
jgi:hypothetical protein